MTQEEIKINAKEILEKLARLQSDVEKLKQREKTLEEQQRKKFTIIDETMSEIWDNEEDEVWNDY